MRGSGPREGERGGAPAEVARFRYRHEAELARGYLDDAGVPASVIADVADQIQYGKGFAAPARVLVREEDVSLARRVLERAGIATLEE